MTGDDIDYTMFSWEMSILDDDQNEIEHTKKASTITVSESDARDDKLTCLL